ncbi:MAG: hypothetical protein L0H79_08080 [Intrasporangium sp.]|uniref:hypothetical protein n=1 Tax=Intrasporangium sp. TaxID=1925024 RepID=UPI002648FDF2|nr:hypothetical protein [Intrasporangium sp.]MDN5795695.1 hypothetical protein [Intrasporangium sp.]
MPTEWAWRDVCLAVLGEADETEARILRQLLGDVLIDHDVPKREARQVQQAIGKPDDELAFGLEEGSSADEVSAVIWPWSA